MKNKAGIISILILIAEFVGFLIWGLNLSAGDEMGYGLIVIYGIMPLTALVLSALLAAKKSVFVFPVAILAIISHIFLPFFIYGTFEIGLSLCLSAIPSAIGGIIGFIIYRTKCKTNKQTAGQ